MEYKNLNGKIEEQKSEIRWFFAVIFLLLSVTVIQSASLIKLLGGKETISYDLEECIEVIDEKTNHTKWKKVDITEDIKERLKSNGYIIN